MPSFLKRISSEANLNKLNFSSISFGLDESDFSIMQKFSYQNNRTNNHKKRTIKICKTCGNAEFSFKSRYCKICGNQIENLFY